MYVGNKKFTSSKLAVVDSGTSALVVPTGNFIIKFIIFFELDLANYFLFENPVNPPFPSNLIDCNAHSNIQLMLMVNSWGCECY